MEHGYVKLWRKCLDSGLLQNAPAWQLFGYLLLKATYRPHKQVVSGAVFDLQPGDVIFGRAKAAEELGVGEQSIRTALKLLEKLEIVTSRATNKCTVISFVNWHRYQDDQPAPNQQVNQPLTSGQPAPNQRLTTNKNVRKKEEYINTPPLPPTGGEVCADEYELSCGTSANSMDTRQCEASLAADEIKAQSSLQAGGMEPRPCCPPNGDVTNTSDTGSRANSMDTRPCEAKGRKAKTPRMPKGADLPPYTEQFERIWAKYPRKDAKGKAYKAYMELLKAGALPETDDLIERITYRKFEPDWERENGKYVPYFSTWLHNRGWEDAGCFSDTTPEQRARNERASAIYAKYNGGMWKPGLTVEQVEENCDRMYAELEAEGLL